MSTWKDLAAEYESENNQMSDDADDELDELNSQGDNLNEKSVNYFEVAGICAGVAGVVGEIILPHPFIVLRRQCQITNVPYRFHWTPFTILPAFYKVIKYQGFSSVWKGLGSSICFWLLNISGEAIISDALNLPKTISKHSSMKKMGQNVMLKGLTSAVMAPFYAACLVETVQSDLACSSSNVLNFFTEGFHRLLTFTKEPVSRLLPVWKIVPVVSIYMVLHYTVRNMAEFSTHKYMSSNRIDIEIKTESDIEIDDVYQKHFIDLCSSISGLCVADVLLYPLELVVNRLCVQGTRILIDNIDKPDQLLPVTTSYHGMRDAFNSIVNETTTIINNSTSLVASDSVGSYLMKLDIGINESTVSQLLPPSTTTTSGEGAGGLYRGFGALILQYAIQFLILYSIQKLIETLIIRDSTVKQRVIDECPHRHSPCQRHVSPIKSRRPRDYK